MYGIVAGVSVGTGGYRSSPARHANRGPANARSAATAIRNTRRYSRCRMKQCAAGVKFAVREDANFQIGRAHV